MAPYLYNDPNPLFVPATNQIAAITNANPAQVTTATDHGYVDGLVVRMIVPVAYGMPELNGLAFVITVTGATTFTIPVDTTGINSFVIPVGMSPRFASLAQVVPAGEIGDIQGSETHNRFD